MFLASGPQPTPTAPGMKRNEAGIHAWSSLGTLRKGNDQRNPKSFQDRKLPWTSFCSGTSVTLLPRTLLTAIAEVGYHKIPAQKNYLALTIFF